MTLIWLIRLVSIVPRYLVGLLQHKRRIKMIRKFYPYRDNPFEVVENVRWAFEKAFI